MEVHPSDLQRWRRELREHGERAFNGAAALLGFASYGASLVLFVVAADEGWMPQSAEHLAAIDALGHSVDAALAAGDVRLEAGALDAFASDRVLLLGLVAAFALTMLLDWPTRTSAGGVGLAAAMDISIAADDAKFGFTEVRVGVAP